MQNLATLARKTGLNRSTIQNWADRDVFLKIPGTGEGGTQRMFEDVELDIALILRAEALAGTVAPVAKAIAAALRSDLTAEGEGFNNPNVGRAIGVGKAGGDAWLVYTISPMGDGALTASTDVAFETEQLTVKVGGMAKATGPNDAAVSSVVHVIDLSVVFARAAE
nr:hypothetical protein 7 [Rhodospirillaceae bacterium]